MLIGIRFILPALLGLLLLACATATGQQPVPEPTATVAATPTVSPSEEIAVSSGIFHCDPDTPHPFQKVNWTEYQPLRDVSIQLPSDVWEQAYKERGLVVYFLPVSGTTGNKWSAALTFYGYYENYIRDELGLTWDEFVQQNLADIADDGAVVANYRLVRQWEVEPTPLHRPGLGQFVPTPTVWDQRAEFRYGGVGDDTTVAGYGMSKRIGPSYYFVRLDVCSDDRNTNSEAVAAKLFDSLSDSGYGNYR